MRLGAGIEGRQFGMSVKQRENVGRAERWVCGIERRINAFDQRRSRALRRPSSAVARGHAQPSCRPAEIARDDDGCPVSRARARPNCRQRAKPPRGKNSERPRHQDHRDRSVRGCSSHSRPPRTAWRRSLDRSAQDPPVGNRRSDGRSSPACRTTAAAMKRSRTSSSEPRCTAIPVAQTAAASGSSCRSELVASTIRSIRRDRTQALDLTQYHRLAQDRLEYLSRKPARRNARLEEFPGS